MSRRIGIASAIWGVSILLSRLVGLVREAVIGRVLGGGATADVYWAAFTLPDWMNYLLAGGALSIVFIPIFGGYLAKGQPDKAWQSFSFVANFMMVLMAIVVPAVWLGMPWLVHLVGPGFDPDQLTLLTRLSRIMLAGQVFHLLGGLLGATLMARDHHTLPALAPLVYTGCIVAGGLIGGDAEGFAWGVLAGAFLGPFLLPLYGNLKLGFGWKPLFDLQNADVKLYLRRTVPIMLGFSVVMVDDWVWRAIGSTLAEGAVSTLQYAKTLMKVPMGVFGLATGAAAYPTLARLAGAQRYDEAYDTLTGSVRRMLILALGAQVGLTVAGAEISQVVYGDRIALEQHSSIGLCLGIFGIGLWAWSAQQVVPRGFYARGQTWPPTVIGSVVAVASLPVYWALANQLGTTGLAMATTISISVYVVALIVALRRNYQNRAHGFGSFLARTLPAAGVGIAAGLSLETVLTLPHPLLQGGALAVVACTVYAAVLAALRVPEFTEVVKLVAGKLRRKMGL